MAWTSPNESAKEKTETIEVKKVDLQKLYNMATYWDRFNNEFAKYFEIGVQCQQEDKYLILDYNIIMKANNQIIYKDIMEIPVTVKDSTTKKRYFLIGSSCFLVGVLTGSAIYYFGVK